MMRNEHLRSVVIATLLAVTIVSQSSSARASHTGFDRDEYQAREGDSYVDLSVGAGPCCPAGSGQFDYFTANLSAVAGTDYEQTSGTVTTATCAGSTNPPVSTCTIRVPLISDELYEGDELFKVRLSNFRGTFVPERTTAFVRIADDDPAPATNAPSISRSNTSRQVGGTRSPGSERRSLAEPIETNDGLSQTTLEISESTEGKEQGPLSSSSKAPGIRSPEQQNSPISKLIPTAGILLALAAGALLILKNARLKRSADE